jgi:hypothetical protein
MTSHLRDTLCPPHEAAVIHSQSPDKDSYKKKLRESDHKLRESVQKLRLEYRDLKGFEQQSWEKLNHVAVIIFNHQTHRGGARNESAAQVLMRSFRRKNVIWLCKQIGPNDLKDRIDMLENES